MADVRAMGVWFAVVLALACSSAAGCRRDSAHSAQPQSEFAQPPPDGDDADPLRPDACPANTAGGAACDPLEAQCSHGDSVCTCEQPCMGMEPEPGTPNAWSCRTRDRRCPEAAPQDGDACQRPGLRCGYGSCGGASATCEGGRWRVRWHDPPP